MRPGRHLKGLLTASVLTALAMGCAAAATPVRQAPAAVLTTPATPVPEAPAAVPTLSTPAQAVPASATPAAPAAPTATPPPAVGAGPTPRLPLTVATLLPQAETNATGPATETSELASHFEAALNVGDVDKALALFADSAEVKVPPDRYLGHTQIG